MLGRIAIDVRPLLEKALLRASLVGAEAFAEAVGIIPVTDVAAYRAQAERAARKLIGNLVTSIGQGQRLAIREVIATGYREGLPVKRLAETLRGVVGLDERRAGALAKFQAKLQARADLTAPQRARLAAREEARLLKSRTLAIAKTESVRAGSRAQEAVWQAAIAEGELAGEQLEREWLPSPSACPEICAPLAGARAEIDGEFPGEGGDGPPAHPNCLPPGVLVVPVGRVQAATQRPYNGFVVILRTAGGHELACTPNHPVLTGSGEWKAAELVDAGEYVVARCREKHGGFLDVQNEHSPALIEDIAKTLRGSTHVATVEVEVSAEDFHGDVANQGEVAVIWSDRRLLTDELAPRPQQLRQLVFEGANAELTRFASPCPQHSFPLRAAAPTDRAVGGRDLVTTLLRGHPGVPNQQLLAHGAQPRAALAQGSLDNATVDAIAMRELQDRIAGLVAPEQIISREVHPFRGHVFNLQTSAGAFFAGGILTHNCQCGQRLVRRGE
jgi:hypothetical protein